MATAIGKLGFVADPASGSFTLLVLNRLLLLTHFLDLVLVRLKLLMQFPAGRQKEEGVREPGIIICVVKRPKYVCHLW